MLDILPKDWNLSVNPYDNMTDEQIMGTFAGYRGTNRGTPQNRQWIPSEGETLRFDEPSLSHELDLSIRLLRQESTAAFNVPEVARTRRAV